MRKKQIGLSDRVYIDDFVNDLNYSGIILYIGNVDPERLSKRLMKDYVNKTYRLEYALNKEDPTMKNFIYIENCDLEDLCDPIYVYMEKDNGSYDVCTLREDNNGEYYIADKIH